jgi:uncharacterized membrane protein YidH (DUF202 family)
MLIKFLVRRFKQYLTAITSIAILSAVSIKALAANVGQVADNATEPVTLTSGFLLKVCLVLSIGFIFAGILKFIERRRNPDIMLNRPIWLLTFGILLGILVIIQYHAPINS